MSGFEELVQLENRNSNPNDYALLAVMVDHYDLANHPHSVLGRLVDENGRPTEELVRVYLREDRQRELRDKPRTEIQDLANPKASQHTDIGGVLFFNYAFPTETPGTYSAWWVQSASHTPTEARTACFWANVSFRETPTKVNCYVDYFKANESVKIEDQAMLAEVIAQQLGGAERPMAHRHSVVRLLDHRGRTVSACASTQWVREPTRDWSDPCTGEQSLEAFRQERAWALLVQAFADGDVAACEVIPGGRVYAGETTRTDILGQPKLVEFLQKMYHSPKGDRLYVPTWMAVRQREDGQSMFLTIVRPASGSPMRYRLADIPSAHYAPPAERHVASLPTVRNQSGGAGGAGGEGNHAGLPSAGGNRGSTASYPGLPNQTTATQATRTSATATAPPRAGGAKRPFQVGADGPDERPGTNGAAPRSTRPVRPPVPPVAPPLPAQPAEGAQQVPAQGLAAEDEVPFGTPEQDGSPPDTEQLALTPEDEAALGGPSAPDDEFDISPDDMDAINSLAPRLT